MSKYLDHAVNIVFVDFDKGNEMVVKNEDDSFTILINARLSRCQQLKAYRHALKHIKNSDFYKEDVQEIEKEAHDS